MHTKAPHRRADDGRAFLPDPGSGPTHVSDEFAELVAEEFLASATSAEEVSEDVRDELLPEELGGPFLEDRASMEIVNDIDESNPKGSTREPVPTAMRGSR